MTIMAKKDALSQLVADSWTRLHCSDAVHRREVIRCANGHNQHLQKTRTVDPTGLVSGGPVACVVAQCGWSDQITLGAWT